MNNMLSFAGVFRNEYQIYLGEYLAGRINIEETWWQNFVGFLFGPSICNEH